MSGYYTWTMIGERTGPLAQRLHGALDGRLEGYLRTDGASRALWSTDASIYHRKPVGVVVARSEEDVKRALEAARELGLSITPRGTGTSLAGQATGPGLALDLSEMQGVLDLDLENRRCSVEPGTDRKSTRLNSSHANISYAVFCLKKKKRIIC